MNRELIKARTNLQICTLKQSLHTRTAFALPFSRFFVHFLQTFCRENAIKKQNISQILTRSHEAHRSNGVSPRLRSEERRECRFGVGGA